ncbi:MAG: DUF92 domain-containing protein [Hyphomicrobiales bacterium]
MSAAGVAPGSTTILAGLAIAAAGAAIVLATGQGTRGAALAGFLTAAAMVWGFGAAIMGPVALFVLAGGALTRLGRERKERAQAAEANRGRRSASNVIAKLGLPAALGLAAAARPDAIGPLALATTASIAGAFADTAATEVGPLAGGGARRLGPGGFTPVPHGTPGGISVAGILAGAAAAAAAGALAWGLGLVHASGGAIAAVAGVAASWGESALAAGGAGARVGHFGRNVFVSSVSALLAIAAGAVGGGSR